MTVKLVKPTLDIVKEFKIRNPEFEDINMILDNPSLAFYFNDEPLAIFGVQSTSFEHTVTAYALTTNNVKKYKDIFHEMTKEMLRTALSKEVEVVVIDVRQRNLKWAKSLGFQLTNIVKNYYDKGEDAYIHVLHKGEI